MADIFRKLFRIAKKHRNIAEYNRIEKIEGVMEKLYEERTVLESMLGKEIPEDAESYSSLKKC